MVRLFERLRDALVEVLSVGTWDEIRRDHERVGLTWREDLEPGWGKPKYVDRVLRELADSDVLSTARRALNVLSDRSLIPLQNAVWWVEAAGVSSLSTVTRRTVATILDGHRLHPRLDAEAFVSGLAQRDPQCSKTFFYRDGNQLMAEDPDVLALQTGQPSQSQTTSHVELLEGYGLVDWPDKRMTAFLERLVHPEVRVGDEQLTLVDELNEVLRVDGWRLEEVERLSGHPVFSIRPLRRGVDGKPKNLIFASTGPKPELGFSDAVNNDIVILRNKEHCLVYDQPITEDGLLWAELVGWWANSSSTEITKSDARRQLGERLRAATGSPAEKRFFDAYFRCFKPKLDERLPALIPQVYLHFDPATLRQLRARGEDKRFPVQRMDFLMLLPDRIRVVLEVDGQQHYADGMHQQAYASPRIYADTMSADRRLRLAGYEMYRFGGYELRNKVVAAQNVETFFNDLFARHGVKTG
jgi:very-short-patch-repair endonuclease